MTSALPKSKLYLGWLRELGWSLLFLLQIPVAAFWKRRSLPGRRPETMVLLGDGGASPLLYLRMTRRLHRAGFSVHVFCCANVFRRIPEHSRRLAAFLAEQDIQDGILIGHGLGSLAALSLPDHGRQRIRHLISMGTPFHGSRVFLTLPFVPAFGDMAAGSDFLLLHRMNALLFPSFDPFSAWQDQWIVPFNLAHFGQGRDLIFDQSGHYNLILGAENIDTLIDFINERYPLADSAVAMARIAGAASDSARVEPANRARAKAEAGETKGAANQPAPSARAKARNKAASRASGKNAGKSAARASKKKARRK